MGRYTYQPSVGPAQYRRTLYAYWRRSSSPTFLFDNAQRRVCEVRTNLTNTPLHALTLLNDTGMLEASRVLAEFASNSPDTGKGLNLLAARILSRELEVREQEILKREWTKAINYYDSNTGEALLFTRVGQQDTPSAEKAPAIAAWMTLASMMFNLDEAITRE